MLDSIDSWLMIFVTFFDRWLPKAAIRTVEGDPSDCILVVGVSRPRMALAVLIVMLLSLFLTFHIIYDSALSTLHKNHNNHVTENSRPPIFLLSRKLYPVAARRLPQVSSVYIFSNSNHVTTLIIQNEMSRVLFGWLSKKFSNESCRELFYLSKDKIDTPGLVLFTKNSKIFEFVMSLLTSNGCCIGQVKCCIHN